MRQALLGRRGRNKAAARQPSVEHGPERGRLHRHLTVALKGAPSLGVADCGGKERLAEAARNRASGMSGRHGMAGPDGVRAVRSGRARTVCEGGPARIIGLGGEVRLQGVVIDLSAPELRILLVDRQGGTVLSFGPFGEEDVIATWRSMAGASGLTPMMRAGAETTALGDQLGPMRLGQLHLRRRVPLLGRRRPRFLARRKSARLPVRPLIYREREIVAGIGS